MATLILTVDDSPSIRLMMRLTLTGEGYEVMQAGLNRLLSIQQAAPAGWPLLAACL